MDPELDLTLVSPIEAEEMMAMYEVYEVDYRMVVLILVEDVEENLTEQQKISDWREIRPHSNQGFAHLYNVLLHFYVLVLSYALLPLLNVLNNHRVDR